MSAIITDQKGQQSWTCKIGLGSSPSGAGGGGGGGGLAFLKNRFVYKIHLYVMYVFLNTIGQL